MAENIPAKKRLALIVNGINPDDPDTLEAAFRQKGLDVTLFDMDTLRGASGIDTHGYDGVYRMIKGNRNGVTGQSLELQKAFVAAGAIPYLSEEATATVTDKIRNMHNLSAGGVDTVAYCAIGKDENTHKAEIDKRIRALGEPAYPCVVRKSTGSGDKSFAVVASSRQAAQAVEAFRQQGVGVIIHKLPPRLTPQMEEELALPAGYGEEGRTYQFRVVVIGDKTYTSLSCSPPATADKPAGFGLNTPQKAEFFPLSASDIPGGVEALAKKAAAAQGLQMAAVDIVLDNASKPKVMDMNPSPDLSSFKERKQELTSAIADSVVNMLEGKSRTPAGSSGSVYVAASASQALRQK